MQVIHQLMSKRTEKNKEMGQYKLNNCEQRAKDLAWYRNILCENLTCIPAAAAAADWINLQLEL